MLQKKIEIPIDQIILTNRKTIALEISADAKLIIRAPFYTSEKTIRKIVLAKIRWIEKKQKEVKEKQKKIPFRKFSEGERFPYLGNTVPLHIATQSDLPLFLENDRFLISETCIPRAENIFSDWYKQEAKKIFSERASWFAERTGINYGKLKISNAKKRWGSCSSAGDLYINWLLIMAPLEVIDYVVVHELVHIEVRNHSRKFWNKVESILPAYKKQKNWLRKNGYFISFSNPLT